MKTAKTLSQVLPQVLLLLALGLFAHAAGAQALRVPYSANGVYPGATGLGDIAEWKFDGATPGADLSGNNHKLTPRGQDSRFAEGALVIEEKLQPGDKSAGASTADKPDLTPKGAFTAEIWFAPDAAFLQKESGYLLDKKYIPGSSNPKANHDYMLFLRRKETQYYLEAQLGFGQDSKIVRSTPQTLEAGKTYHAALSYDGAGTARLFLDGLRIAHSEWEGSGAISDGSYALVIGDRVGSIHYRFLGRIFRVRLSSQALNFISGQVLVEPAAGRTAFARMEKGAELRIKVTNDTAARLQNARLQLDIPGAAQARRDVPALDVGESTLVTIAVNTQLRPDSYTGAATVTDATGKPLGDAAALRLMVVPRALPHQMPVVLWGSIGDKTLQDLQEIGFTHQLVYPVSYPWVWENGTTKGSLPPDAETGRRQQLDEMFAMQLGGVATLSPGRVASESHPEFNRVDRTGKPYSRANVDGLFPRVQKFAGDVGQSIAQTFDGDPGLQGALIHSEVRDGTQLSFHDIDKKAYRDFSGDEIPSEITSARGYNYKNIPDFPANRIVPDDYRLLKFYRWFWKEGDGWNKLNSLVNDGLKTAGRNRFWTFNDPAVRAPSIWGNSGNVDYLSHWTYTYPNPLKIALAADEMFALAEGRPGQQVMSMTQIIWYRTQTTYDPKPGQAQWWETPESKFISIAPDHLSEALWLELSRPVQGIMYHGWGSLTGARHSSYKLTNRETRVRLTELTRDIVRPLGPTLLQVPGHKSDVAFLESFASQMLAGRGTYGGGNGWGADAYFIATYAGLQPEIVYDETVQQKGLDQYKVLFLMHCDVLPQSVAEKIKAFQRRGGLVVGDEFLAPGIQPDILLTSEARGKPHETKKRWQERAAELQKQLSDYYSVGLQSSNPDVVVRARPYKDAEYVFTVNDHRTYGDYVGQYQRVMEKGLPAQSQVSLERSNGYVYDLMNRREVKTQRAGGKLQFPVELGAGEGNVFLVTDKPAGQLQVTVAATATRGRSTPLAVRLNDTNGQPLQAVVPLEVTIRDAQGRIAEHSGFYGAANGQLKLELDIAPNDAPGKWQVEVGERLRGQKVTKSFTVR